MLYKNCAKLAAKMQKN